jgi:phosphatidylglycerophosphate synthase
MSDYQPTSRRPIASAFRRTAESVTRLCVRSRVHPDAISYGSIVAAAGAGAMLWWSGRYPWLLLLVPVLLYLRLYLNMLDGMVALAGRTASLRGEILNDLPDRVSDVLIFVGLAHSGLCHVVSGYWAAIMAVMTAYVGMLGQAVGVRREFGGVMSKPWRMLVLHVGAWAAFGIALSRTPGARHDFGSVPMTVLDWTCIVIVAGCVQTIAVRLRRIMAGLRAKVPEADRVGGEG